MKKTTLITGASKGIGYACAKDRRNAGEHVIGMARHKPGTFPGDFLEVDLSDPGATREAANEVLKIYGRVDHLVNNVGLVRPAGIGSVDLDDFDDVINLTLKPAISLTQAFLPGMKERHYGRIVNISSLVVLGIRDRTAYSAAKTAMVSFTRSWALDLALDGIAVNSVAPGPTVTELFRENNPAGSDAEKRFLRMVPMERFATPEEIASAVGFFLKEESGIITGQTLHVDGGASIGHAAI
jgi:NAD(P)-dependent dehydrogenase (short-subunit alcohol dehydrogenase family)